MLIVDDRNYNCQMDNSFIFPRILLCIFKHKSLANAKHPYSHLLDLIVTFFFPFLHHLTIYVYRCTCMYTGLLHWLSIKNPPAMQEVQEIHVQSLDWEDATEEETATPSSILLFLYIVKVKVTQSCPTLCDPMDYTVHRNLQARILGWVSFHFSRESSQPRD